MKIKIFVAFIMLFNSYLTFSQIKNIDYNQFIRETQKNSSDGKKISLVWWIPIEFWDITLHNNNTLSEEQIIKFMETLKSYSIFAVIDGEVSGFGGFTYESVDSISQNIVLIDNDNKNFKPLKYEALDAFLQNLLSVFKPLLKNSMGQLGENMNFFVFPDIDGNKRISNPYLKGCVTIKIKDKEYKWRTPLGTLMPQKVCPKDGELMNGAWEFCPWDGEKLIEIKK